MSPLSKIAIDYTAAYQQGAGIGRYVRQLIEALGKLDSTHHYRFFVAGATVLQLQEQITAFDPDIDWNPTRLSPRWLTRIWYRMRIPLPIEAFVGRVDLFHATDFVLPPHLPWTKTLLTVHDLSFVRVPEATPPLLKAYLDVVVPQSARRASHILADSSATKADLMALYGISEDKITVLLSGVDERFQHDKSQDAQLRAKYQIGNRPYIISVGTVQPRKNYVRLVEALQTIRTRGYDMDLVIAGGHGWLDGPLYRAIDEKEIADHVHLIGFAHEGDLPGLYSGAVCVAFPSLYEGFGFPVLEGMACGVPVLTSNVSSLPEVAGDAALTVDPYDTEEISETLHRIITDDVLRAKMIEAGYQQASRFTWEAAARHLLEVYDQVLSL